MNQGKKRRGWYRNVSSLFSHRKLNKKLPSLNPLAPAIRLHKGLVRASLSASRFFRDDIDRIEVICFGHQTA